MISVNLLCVKILIINGIYISVKLYKCGIYFIKEKKREKMVLVLIIIKLNI